MGIYGNYRRKHTVHYSHYRSVRERWEEFKIKVKIVFWTAVICAGLTLIIVSSYSK